MSYVTASRLTRRYDLSDPWFIRMITGRKANVLTAVNQVSFLLKKVRPMHWWAKAALGNQP